MFWSTTGAMDVREVTLRDAKSLGPADLGE